MPDDHILVRDSVAADIPAFAAIYGHWVRHGRASFELEPPIECEMAERREAIVAGGYPYVVAVAASGHVLGYTYASAYRRLARCERFDIGARHESQPRPAR